MQFRANAFLESYVKLDYLLKFGEIKIKLDGVPGTQTSRLLYSLTTAIEATALFVQQHVKGAIIIYHVTPSMWKNGCYAG